MRPCCWFFQCVGLLVCYCYWFLQCFKLHVGFSSALSSLSATSIGFSNVLDSLCVTFIGFSNVSEFHSEAKNIGNTKKSRKSMIVKLCPGATPPPGDSLKIMVFVVVIGFSNVSAFQKPKTLEKTKKT